MKKALFVAVILIILVVFLTPFLPGNFIRVYSNVNISLEDIFIKKGSFYYIYVPKLPVKIQRKFFYINVFYEEPVVYRIKFENGTFAITKKGHIIKNNNEFNLKVIKADMDAERWDENFAAIFTALNEMQKISEIEEFAVFDNMEGFYDKNGVAVIMGGGSYFKKILEYNKVIDLYKKEVKKIKSIDLRFLNQAVVVWRSNE